MVCSTIEFNYTMLHRTTPHASECTCIMYMCSKCIVHIAQFNNAIHNKLHSRPIVSLASQTKQTKRRTYAINVIHVKNWQYFLPPHE